ncbi:MAG: transporter, permease protein [Francisellaceae bacterium]|nr:transporter, permease protein [Francisellaceae bacterium]
MNLLHFISDTLTIVDMEIRKTLRDPLDLFTRAIQPILWLTIFGQVFNNISHVNTGNINYLTYITPGILAQSILFSAIFYGIAVIWERDLGILHKLLVSPAYRISLVLGKALTAGLRSTVQIFIIYCVAVSLNVDIKFEIMPILGVLIAMILGAAIFSTFSLIIACLVKTRERFMGIGQVMTMPLFFASNAIYPIEIMPNWLKTLARFNPLTYLVDALRGLLIEDGISLHGIAWDFGILAMTFFILLLIATKLYPSLAR